MAAYDISYSPTSGTGALKVTIDCAGGAIEYSASAYLGYHLDNNGRKSHVFAIHFRDGNGSGPGSKTFLYDDFIPGKDVYFDASGTEYLDVLVLGPSSSGNGDETDKKKEQVLKIRF